VPIFFSATSLFFFFFFPVSSRDLFSLELYDYECVSCGIGCPPIDIIKHKIQIMLNFTPEAIFLFC